MYSSKRIIFNLIKNSFSQSAPIPRVKIKLKKKDQKSQLLISCKQTKLNHYAQVSYGNLDEVPLASKGWAHSKSNGDFFTVNKVEELETPTYSFREVDIHYKLVDALRSEGIKEMTEFQFRAINAVREGTHLLLAAETGCGKTLAYLLPIIQELIDKKAEELNTPKAIILVPNRELAHQVGDIAKFLGYYVGLSTKVLVGGRTKSLMVNPVVEDIDILVATPGAIGKLSSIGLYKLNQVRYTVLDEADTLIDDSFIDRMEGLIKRQSQAQLILVSATIPTKLPAALIPAEQSMKHIISPKIHKPLLNITQKFLRISKSSKPAHLLQIAKANTQPMLIFSNRNETCNWVALFLRENGVSCANINGDMNYAIRIEQWNSFVSGDVKILSATDVGSRGLNTIQVKHVLNYDFPLYAADYLHRIGRVGRLGSSDSCKVTNFVAGVREIKMVQQVELAIRKNQQIENVDGNITNIVQRKIARSQRESA